MKMLPVVSVAALLGAAASFSLVFAQDSPPVDPPDCATLGALHFVCGVVNAEDELLIPSTHWIITGGMRPGGGIKLVDTDAKTERFFYTEGPDQVSPDKKLYPNCPTPPDPKAFIVHGISLHTTPAPGQYTLYAVSHGALESIEVFGVDAREPQPKLTWKGCVPLPEKGANGVSAFSDGTIIVTISDRPGTTKSQELNGEPTGDVLEWKPGTDSFHIVAGTQLAGDNGIEISPDESEFYVVAFGTHTVYVFSRANPSKPLRSTVAPGFMPDNLRWTGDKLIAAGSVYDEPACGGTRIQALSNPSRMRCNRGYMVDQLDPKTMTWSVLAYAEASSAIGGVATGVVAGNTLWIGANSEEGLAYRTLPSTEPPPQSHAGNRR
jgi:hypothetical protein